MSTFVPADPFHPGVYIKDEINARRWTLTHLAFVTGISRKVIINLIRGQSEVTPHIAQALAKAFGQEAQTWMNLQASYELALNKFDPHLDPGIAPMVLALRKYNVETFESCEGGEGHPCPEPFVRFHGNAAEGMRALSAAINEGLPVMDLRRAWSVIGGEITGPWWEITFVRVPTTARS